MFVQFARNDADDVSMRRLQPFSWLEGRHLGCQACPGLTFRGGPGAGKAARGKRTPPDAHTRPGLSGAQLKNLLATLRALPKHSAFRIRIRIVAQFVPYITLSVCVCALLRLSFSLTRRFMWISVCVSKG